MQESMSVSMSMSMSKSRKWKTPRLTNWYTYAVSTAQCGPTGVVERDRPHSSFEHGVDLEFELWRDRCVVECPEGHGDGAVRWERTK